MSKRTFRGFKDSSTCKALVRIDGAEKEAWLLFRPGYNWEEIGDEVILNEKGEPAKTYRTDDVEVISILPWEEPYDEAVHDDFGQIPVADAP
jgi:hypothetical protein